MPTPNDVTSAASRLQEAQSLLEQVRGDNARLKEFERFLPEAIERATRLQTYYSGPGQPDIELTRAQGDPAADLPVAGEDEAWDDLVSSHDSLMRLLRILGLAITSGY